MAHLRESRPSEWFPTPEHAKFEGKPVDMRRRCDVTRIQEALERQFGSMPQLRETMCPMDAEIRWQKLAHSSRRLLLVNGQALAVQNGRAHVSDFVPTMLGLERWPNVTDFLPCFTVRPDSEYDCEVHIRDIISHASGPVEGPGFVENACVAVRKEGASLPFGVGHLLDPRAVSNRNACVAFPVRILHSSDDCLTDKIFEAARLALPGRSALESIKDGQHALSAINVQLTRAKATVDLYFRDVPGYDQVKRHIDASLQQVTAGTAALHAAKAAAQKARSHSGPRCKTTMKQVMAGRADKTRGGLTKDKIVKNAKGRVVSKRKSEQSKGQRSLAIRRWSKAVQAARRELDIRGFVKIKSKQWANESEKKLYKRAKELLPSIVLDE
jgi:hypothetical protein